MKISLNGVSKLFRQQWVFPPVSAVMEAPGKYAVLGANGSGKSTLLRMIAGMHKPDKGAVIHYSKDRELPRAAWYRHLAYCAPGSELVEELTLAEMLDFHFSFKKMHPAVAGKDIAGLLGLAHSAHKPLADFSSGMKQRVKLAQAFFTDSAILLLDEPCTNLDAAGIALYHQLIEEYTPDRLLIVASNDPQEYGCCDSLLRLSAPEKTA